MLPVMMIDNVNLPCNYTMLTIVRVIFLHLSNLICSVSLMVTSKDDLLIVMTPTITLNPTSGPVGAPVAVTAHELYRKNFNLR